MRTADLTWQVWGPLDMLLQYLTVILITDRNKRHSTDTFAHKSIRGTTKTRRSAVCACKYTYPRWQYKSARWREQLSVPGSVHINRRGSLAVCWAWRMTQASICSLSHPPLHLSLVVRGGFYEGALLCVMNAWNQAVRQGVLSWQHIHMLFYLTFHFSTQ